MTRTLSLPWPLKHLSPRNRTLFAVLACLLALTLLYLFGPRPARPVYTASWPVISVPVEALEDYIQRKEEGLPIKEDNHSRIIWGQPDQKKATPWALLYLHGFSASWFEGSPLHRELASRFHLNLYLPRLAHHGLEDPEPLRDLTPESLYLSSLNALAVARRLGRRVIVMGTSTGATLAILLAAMFPDKVQALMLYSPNIRIREPFAWILSQPWGLQIARLVKGSPYQESGETDPVIRRYWFTRYRLEGAVALQTLLETTMTEETFRRVTCPVFMGYYYRDEEHQDPVVEVSAMLEMFEKLGTLDQYKIKRAFPGAETHVIGCRYRSRAYQEVVDSSIRFVTQLFYGRKPPPGQP